MAAHQPPQLPSELDNDQQAAVLYSPFREKSLNPQSWSRKMKFWHQVLSQTAMERRMVTVDVPALSLLFERKGIAPKCLATVVEDLKKSGQIVSLDEQQRAQSWLSWGLSTLVKRPLTWGVARLVGATHTDTAVYVWPAVVKKLSEEIIDLYQASVQDKLYDGLVSLAQLRSLCQTCIPSDVEFQIVLSQLEKDHKITVLELEHKEIVIQFCKSGEMFARPIREIDVQIYRIHTAEKRLEADIEALTLTVDRLLTEARSHLRQGRKNLAKHCLRKKKKVMVTMQNRSASLSKLQDILHNIQEAGTHDMVVKACAAGSSALTHLHKQLSVETVEAVMDDVREAVETAEELNQVMNLSLDVDDDDELEQDLQELLSTYADADTTKEMRNLSLHVKDTGLEQVLPAAREAGTQAKKPHIHSSTQQLLHPLNSLTLDDLELPDVPQHSPQSSRQQTAHTAGPSRQQTAHTAGPSRQQTAHTAAPSRQQTAHTAGPSRQQLSS